MQRGGTARGAEATEEMEKEPEIESDIFEEGYIVEEDGYLYYQYDQDEDYGASFGDGNEQVVQDQSKPENGDNTNEQEYEYEQQAHKIEPQITTPIRRKENKLPLYM